MMNLVTKIRSLQRSSAGHDIRKRLGEFKALQNASEERWFSELCFCILTANAKGKIAWKIQDELGIKGLLHASLKEVCVCIRNNKHRFHNNKARFIVEAREHENLKKFVQHIIATSGESAAREWLVDNIKGIGYKEASHFLRNVGYFDLAILDRHIISLMLEAGILKARPRSLTKKKYLEIEKMFLSLARRLHMSAAELDLSMWCLKTGYVLK